MGSEDHGLWPGDRIRWIGGGGKHGHWPQPGDLGTLDSVDYMDWITGWDGHHGLAGGSCANLERADPRARSDPPRSREPLEPGTLAGMRDQNLLITIRRFHEDGLRTDFSFPSRDGLPDLIADVGDILDAHPLRNRPRRGRGD